jgi:hypothetical protein
LAILLPETPISKLPEAVMNRIGDTEMKIRSFASLPQGWHYGEGAPITEQSLSAALTILGKLSNEGFLRTDAFPGIEGDVQVTAYEQSDFYEFNFNLDGKYMVVHERNGDILFSQEGLTLDETLQKIEDFASEKCEQSDLSIPNTSTTISAGSQVRLSKTPQTTGEFQL